jgi:hypothetical protein
MTGLEWDCDFPPQPQRARLGWEIGFVLHKENYFSLSSTFIWCSS